jgi:Domain of unknown function (DUF1741)
VRLGKDIPPLTLNSGFRILTSYKAYHWAELWRSILSLVRFLSSYASDLKPLPNINTLLDNVVNLVALSLSTGDTFLPGPAEYDDLFYKLVETGDVLVKFRDLCMFIDYPIFCCSFRLTPA